jgi:nicotinamidase-related amidase
LAHLAWKHAQRNFQWEINVELRRANYRSARQDRFSGNSWWISADRERRRIEMSDPIVLRFREQRLERNEQGYLAWRTFEPSQSLVARETTLVLCDVWDTHWCRAAVERLNRLLPRMNDVVRSARAKGVLIVHSPSDTMDFYRDSPARRRVLDVSAVEPPTENPHDDPPLPIQWTAGCDTDNNNGDPNARVWRRQNPMIEIDHANDVISDDGRELYSLYRQRGIGNVLIAGVHTNECILNRTFAIKQMVKWGFNVALIRDLTDCLYTPDLPPYVTHAEGTQLVVAFIEKFWCPTISSEQLL